MRFTLEPFIPLTTADLLGLVEQHPVANLFDAVMRGNLAALRERWDWRWANEQDGNGKTLLIHAVERGHIEIVEFLLQQKRTVFLGYDPAGRFRFFSDPREAQRQLLKGNRVRRIVEPAVDSNLKDCQGLTAWDYGLHKATAD